MCGLHRRFAPLPSRTLRRIPQAVGVVATTTSRVLKKLTKCSFNTAGGRCCYNKKISLVLVLVLLVSIPQAVGVVTT